MIGGGPIDGPEQTFPATNAMPRLGLLNGGTGCAAANCSSADRAAASSTPVTLVTEVASPPSDRTSEQWVLMPAPVDDTTADRAETVAHRD